MRPSSLPMLAACPKFTGQASEFTETGTNRHALLSAYLAGSEDALQSLPEDQRDGVRWAAEYIRLKAPTADYPLECEVKRHFLTPTFDRVEGTPDVTCGAHVFDLKWRMRDYAPQMACYALMLMESGYEEITVHLLYAEPQKAVVLQFTRETAEAAIAAIMQRAADPAAVPTPCDYCGWCANAMTCPPLIERANAVLDGRDEWKLAQYHPSQVTDAEEMGKALRLARQLADWCDSVEHYAKEMALKAGTVPDGFKLQARQGNRFITSVAEAFGKAGLPQGEFLNACEVKLTKLTEVYAALNGMKKAPAERDLERKLGDLVQRKPSTISLVVDKKGKE